MDLFGRQRRRIAELKDWAAGRAIHFESLAEADPARLAGLGGLLEGKRIVYLGEADHFVSEVFAFRLLLLRFLIARGFRWVGEELGTCDGLRIDRFLESGDEAWLARLPSFGDRSAGRADRDDALAGLLASDEYPLEPMRAAHAELARRLRSGERLHWFGVDADNAPGGGYQDMEELLSAGGSASRGLALRLRRVPNESRVQEVERLDAARDELADCRTALEQELGGPPVAQLGRSLLALREGLAFVDASRSAATLGELRPAMARREGVMVELARSVLSEIPREERVVLLGHAAHLSKDWPSARLLDGGAGPPAASLGTELARSHPGEVFSIWLLHAFGEDSQPLAWLPRRLTLARRSVNAALTELGPCFLLPLGETSGLPELLRGEQELRWIYNAGCRTELAQQADALFFVREATPVSSPRW